MKFELQKGSRSRILAAAILIIAALFVARLFYLQIVRHDYYVEVAREEQEGRFVIPASRGEIYAKNGSTPVELVMNERVYTVFADPKVVTEKDDIVKKLREVAGGNIVDKFDELLDKTETRYQVLAKRLTTVQRDKIKEAGFSGIGFQAVSQRVYPEGQLAGQLLGFVNTEGVGAYGLEGYFDEELQGTDGLLKVVTDVSDVPLTIGKDNINRPAVNGKDIVLTIDRNVQSKVEQVLLSAIERTGATNASALVMNPNNGKVIAMANFPTYNPAEYFKVSDPSLFNNNTISAPYEPGSTIKTFTMATAVDKNVARPTDTYNNTDYITVEDRTISNATKGKTGIISFQTAMNWSLNTGFVTLAQRLGNGSEITRGARDTMYDYFYNRFQLGQATGIELANEASGSVISPESELGNAVRYSNMSFGQGMEATMIQVASGFSAVVNGGNYFKPTLVDGYMTATGFEQIQPAAAEQSGAISANTSASVKEMLREARQSGFPGVDKAGYKVGGKTGTSQIIIDGEYSSTQTIASYVGYGGSDAPEYVIMVQIYGKDQVLQGAQHALPIFTDISNWMIDYLKLRPKG